MKAIMSRLKSSSNIWFLSILLILLVFSYAFPGNVFGTFLVWLSCIIILPGNRCLMFESSLPGKRSLSVDARYITALLIMTIHAVVTALLGFGCKGPDQFGYEVFILMLLVSVVYPMMFLLSEKMKGFSVGLLSAFLIVGINSDKSIWPYGELSDFFMWMVLGMALLAISRMLTVWVLNKRGVSC